MIPSHAPGLASPEDIRKFRQLQLVRGLIAALVVLFLTQVADFGIETVILLAGALAGIGLAGFLLKRGSNLLRVLLWHGGLYVFCAALLAAANRITLAMSSAPEMDFLVPSFAADLRLVFFFYAAGFLATWAFWKLQSAVTFEAILTSGMLIWLLSGHRNYRLDAPKQISSLSWKIEWLQKLGAQPQHLLLGISLCFVLLLVAYLVLASNRPVIGRWQTIKSFGPRQKITAVLLPLLVISAMGYYAWYLNANYAVNIARASNGVGPSSELQEGQSNLGFNSAVTATKQPAAMLRLEGDYVDNPYSPMLYLREGALSTYNAPELVKAPPQYDTDVPSIGLGTAYFAPNEDEEDPTRTRLVQSIYLISKHSAPFAVDVPKRIRPIRNPKPERFQIAYQALSMAPTAKLQELIGASVGDPSWNKATWEHYLRAPGSESKKSVPEWIEGETPADAADEHGEDARYRSLAAALTEGVGDPILKAAAIVGYLSDNSIYTRSPGHQVDQAGDPVAPYLFGEKKKGYCVHFAHAAVYLMRLSGIPARIATGYQTDLTYSKDGHVLLMMGDRHAWPEIYIEGRGWMVFDVTPAQAENEPELIPDEDLLEQLMSELDPAPEFIDPLPEDQFQEEAPESILARAITHRLALVLVVLLLLAAAGFKLYLLHGWRWTKDGRKKVRLAYLSFATRMYDRSLPRFQGETRKEYAARLKQEHGIDAERITDFIERSSYSRVPAAPGNAQLGSALQAARSPETSVPKRLLYAASAANPMSLSRTKSM